MVPLAEQGEGGLVGSGDGTINGPTLTGALRWTLFEQPGEPVCATSPLLRIDTDDGAKIHADGRGFAARQREQAYPTDQSATVISRVPTNPKPSRPYPA
jgi:hypothetical protein